MRAYRFLLAAALTHAGPAAAQPSPNCIDYADYIRLAGGVLTGDRALGVAASGDFAYVADGFSGLRVLDVSDPHAPQFAGTVVTPGFAQAVAVNGGIALVAAGSALVVIDVSDPATPQILASVPATNALGVALTGGLAYLADANQVVVVDLSVPASPAILGAVLTAGQGRDLAVAGNHLFVAVDQAGFQVIDVSDPEVPQSLALLDTPGIAQGIAVVGDHAYVADNWAGLAIADIADPAAPAIAGSMFHSRPGVRRRSRWPPCLRRRPARGDRGPVTTCASRTVSRGSSCSTSPTPACRASWARCPCLILPEEWPFTRMSLMWRMEWGSR